MRHELAISVYFIFPAAAYLIGSVPFGLLIGLSRGVDVRRQGSGNIGATNVGRVLGRRWGYLCFALDVAKGLTPVLLAGFYFRDFYQTALLPLSAQWAWLAVGAACVLGHMYPLYLRFRGGKGVATSLGVVLGIWPYFTLTGVMAFCVWGLVWSIWRYVSVASIVAAIVFPVGFVILTALKDDWELARLWPLLVFSGLMAAMVILRHRGNIARLLAGTEPRGGAGKAGHGS
jgi:acyl phosphate:glycerol-3-phosphate acyltransferase